MTRIIAKNPAGPTSSGVPEDASSSANSAKPYAPRAIDVMVYCADIGSMKQGNFGWGRVAASGGEILDHGHGGASAITKLVEMVVSDLAADRAVALGFECPLFVPVPEDPSELGSQRAGEAGRPWCVSAGAVTLAFGIAEVTWILSELRRRQPGVSVYVDWGQFTSSADGGGLFLWEAFVTDTAKKPTHGEDAVAAIETFRDGLPDPAAANAVTAERPLSLIGAALLWSGWSEDPAVLRAPSLVIKARGSGVKSVAA